MIATLKSLKLFGMAHDCRDAGGRAKQDARAEAIDALAQQSSPAWQGAESVLDSLLKAAVAEREVRSINDQTKVARCPVHRDLVGFECQPPALVGFECHASTVNEALVRSLHRGDCIDDAHNVVLIGGPGTGTTHLATAIG